MILLSVLVFVSCDFKKVEEGKTPPKSAMKCGVGKCGASMYKSSSESNKSFPKKSPAMKCGAGKCGAVKIETH